MGHDHHGALLPQKNYKLYFRVAHVGIGVVSLSFILMLAADSHAAFGTWLHGVADGGTIYLMAFLARLCHEGKISVRRFDRLVGFFNTLFLFASAAGIYVETKLGHHVTVFFGMAGTAIVMFVGSWYQHRLMHEAHGHEEHAPAGISGWKSIDQHFLVDMFMALCVFAVAAWKAVEFPGYESIDFLVARAEMTVVFLLGCRNVNDMLRGKKVHV